MAKTKKNSYVVPVTMGLLVAVVVAFSLFRRDEPEPPETPLEPAEDRAPDKSETPKESRDEVAEGTETAPKEGLSEESIGAEAREYELVPIKGGTFLMGSPDDEPGRYPWEGPRHEVRVADFLIGKYPVTNAQYAQFTKDNPSVPKPRHWTNPMFNKPEQPVVGITWDEAKQYCEWAGLRLPTEAEWEYAARAGTKTRFYSGDEDADLERIGWHLENSGGATHPVGKKAPNAFGLYDMLGNIFEWVEDDWHVEYVGAPDDGRAWLSSPRGDTRVYRGGSWYFIPRNCRSAVRYHAGKTTSSDDLGFRAAKSIP